MATQFLNIQEVPEDLKRKVHQSLAFRTGNFVWRVKFTAPMNPATVNNTNIFLTDEFGKTLKTNIRYNVQDNNIEVSPGEPYAEGVGYYLNITTNVQSKGGQKLKSPIRIKFNL